MNDKFFDLFCKYTGIQPIVDSQGSTQNLVATFIPTRYFQDRFEFLLVRPKGSFLTGEWLFFSEEILSEENSTKKLMSSCELKLGFRPLEHNVQFLFEQPVFSFQCRLWQIWCGISQEICLNTATEERHWFSEESMKDIVLSPYVERAVQGLRREGAVRGSQVSFMACD